MVLATMAARPAGPPAQLRCRLLFICVLCWMCFAAYGYEFDLIFQTKCVMEEVSTGTEVTGDYRIYRKTDVNTPVALDVRVRKGVAWVHCTGQWSPSQTGAAVYSAAYATPIAACRLRIPQEWFGMRTEQRHLARSTLCPPATGITNCALQQEVRMQGEWS